MKSRARFGWRRFLACVAIFGLLAGACGGGDDSASEDDGSGADTDDGTVTTEEPADEEPTDTSEPPADDGGEPPDEVMEEPVYGGDLTVLLEAETNSGWDIPSVECALSCITVMRQVADPLTIIGADGEIVPFALSAFEPNDDYTSFILTMREGITFHDGTVADGAALLRNLEEMSAGLLHGQILADLDPENGLVLVDDMTVEVNFVRPVSIFGHYISERTGYLLAPSYWDLPERASQPVIASGPFEMVEWTLGEQTVVRRNDNYWRTDDEGRELPFLDSIVFRPVPDVSTRRSTMESGDADVDLDDFGENKEFWTGAWIEDGGKLMDAPEDRETVYLLLNNGEGSPFADPDLRRALALCTDVEEYKLFREPLGSIANGPFAPGTPGYLEDSGYPAFDPEAGSALLDEIGRPDTILYGTTNVPSNLVTARLFADMWNRNCGLNVEIDQFDQSELITRAITGDFQLFLWRNHGQTNPGFEGVWWHSRHATGIALNFGRITDPDLDALIEASWATDDEAELDSIGQEMNRVFADNVYNLWLSYTEWFNPHQANVFGLDHMSLPDGGLARASVAGRMYLSEVWKT